MNFIEFFLEKRSDDIGSAKKKANHPKYNENYMLEKQKKDQRLKKKTENKAKEMKAKAAILWNKMEDRRRRIGQGEIIEE